MNRRIFISSLLASNLVYLTKNVGASDTEVKTNKSVIFLFLGGGISSVDSFNPKVDVPDEYACISTPIITKAGYMIGRHFPQLAECSKYISPVHNYKTFDGNHNSATAYSFTGMPAFGLPEGAQAKEPSVGAMISAAHGERNNIGVPNYIQIQKSLHDGPAWLGAKNSGFYTDEDGIKNLQINTSPEQFVRRSKMVEEIEKYNGRDNHYFSEWSNLRNNAKNIIMGKAAQAFNLKNENQVWLDRYEESKNGFGKDCLLARRLIEAGAKFITLAHHGWDMHVGIENGFDARCPDLDMHLSNLILDLESKGLLETTLIVVTSEFSRTKMNITAGRDHNPSITSLLLCGGKYGGNVIGQSDKFGLEAQGNPFAPKDLAYTILNWLEVPDDYTVIDNMRRPRHFIQSEARIIV